MLATHRFPSAPMTTALLVVMLAQLGASPVTAQSKRPPWPGQYKLRGEDQDRLTAADVAGPDGIVYPNWQRCGVEGGIPAVEVVTSIEEHGGRADDDQDDSQALRTACEAAGRLGGGAVQLGAGVYYLDRPVTVRHDGVVIRGRGADATRIVFRYSVGDAGISFYWPPKSARIGSSSLIEMHAAPTDLQSMSLQLDDVQLGTWERGQHSGNSFAYQVSGRQVPRSVPDGDHTLSGTALYSDGRQCNVRMPVQWQRDYRETVSPDDSRGAITFLGAGSSRRRIKLGSDGRRGAATVELQQAAAVAPGDCLIITSPATPRWNALTGNACQWGLYRRYMVRVQSVDGKRVTLDQPLRIDFPVADESYVETMTPIRRGAVEDLCIEQTENLWITAVLFRNAWNCWARGVKVVRCGRHPVYGDDAKFCEIRDCLFEDAWFKGGGGTAYVGWEKSYDCLMDHVETFRFRHAPLFQWSASGCVIRNSVFHASDGQWHAGWTNENLMEQCTIDSQRGNGGYGYGLWASPPEDTAHGPNGPRNVVYNCDISSPRAGLWMGGMNENWLILYNRFVVEREAGVVAKTASFDHIIRGNVFALQNDQQAAIQLHTDDCIGVELIDNTIFGGNGQLCTGKAQPLVSTGNKLLPQADTPPSRPSVNVPSIYLWQREQGR